MLYLITDTHLGHQNMLKSCGRPARFTNLILDNCRKMVRSNDTLIHLGDVAWNEEELMRFMKLPGRKILVRGNHDRKSTPYYMEAGFDLVVDSMTMTLQGIRMLFSHAPQYAHAADINIHGHQHDLHGEDVFHRYWPLALEHMGYKPLPLDDKTVGVLQSWVKRGRNPSKKELYALHQGYLGAATMRDYIGNTKAAMPKPLCFWAADGTEHFVGNDDVACFHYHADCLFLAMTRECFEQRLGRTAYTAVQLPWEDERFVQPCHITEQQAETVRRENSPFSFDMVLCWFRVAGFADKHDMAF